MWFIWDMRRLRYFALFWGTPHLPSFALLLILWLVEKVLVWHECIGKLISLIDIHQTPKDNKISCQICDSGLHVNPTIARGNFSHMILNDSDESINAR